MMIIGCYRSRILTVRQPSRYTSNLANTAV